MKEWMTAAEIAEATLPDLPTTKRGVAKLAAAERWDENPSYARQRKGKGGGFEYHFRLLPTLAQVAFAQKTMIVGAAANDEPAQPVAAAVPLSDRAAKERDARLAIVAQFERFSNGMRLNQEACLQVFTDKYNAGSLAVEGWVKDLIPHLSKRTLLRWKSAKKDGQTATLAVDRAQCRRGTGVLDTAEAGRLRNHILALLTQNAHYSAQHVRTLCISEFGEAITVSSGGAPRRIPMPPVRTFQHAIKGLKEVHHVALMKLQNPDQYRSTMAPAGVGTLRHLQEPNQLWQIDASPIDALCVDGRHTIYACIDVFTRRTVFLVSRTPKASAVALLLRKAILALGVPREIKTDNGSDFVAHDTKRLTGTPVTRVIAARAGKLKKITSVLQAALTTGDATITVAINGVAVTTGVITITQAASAAGDIDTAEPTALNAVAAGDIISFTVGGTNASAVAAHLLLEIVR